MVKGGSRGRYGGLEVTTDLQRLYEKYAKYVACLQDDFARHVGPNVAPAYRPKLLSFDDFCRAWESWGALKGTQEMWQRRFEVGYWVEAEALSKRLRAILSGLDAQAPDSSAGRAA